MSQASRQLPRRCGNPPWQSPHCPPRADRQHPRGATDNRRTPHPLSRTDLPYGYPVRYPYGIRPDPGPTPYSGTMSGAPSRAASAVRSSGWRCDSRSASTRFW
ncbi:hypothetical protein GCM10010329_05700 [Streptomyces spiroverticillatus]|uniref:Uncharacterized protein n=1 Tax=Streptomyces finlayi TaxID=67296 RepID=A0A918WSW7_9ACTN|nr:hypothetical protein GCM10010329_05700 [Streptomyces spiroverticillatus]GHC79450.1 hypothetical protein GCM10010334_05680 [Streptomyces finlayi]